MFFGSLSFFEGPTSLPFLLLEMVVSLGQISTPPPSIWDVFLSAAKSTPRKLFVPSVYATKLLKTSWNQTFWFPSSQTCGVFLFYASQTGSPNKPSAPWPHLLTPWLMLSKWKKWMKISWIKHQLSSDLISSWFPDFDFLLKKSWFNSWFRIEKTNNEWYKGCPLLDQDRRDVNLTSSTSNDAVWEIILAPQIVEKPSVPLGTCHYDQQTAWVPGIQW